jgi:hypothetical protein
MWFMVLFTQRNDGAPPPEFGAIWDKGTYGIILFLSCYRSVLGLTQT